MAKNSFSPSKDFFLVFKTFRKQVLNFPFDPYLCAPAGLTRPAPAELPQGRKAARVGGCSGAM